MKGLSYGSCLLGWIDRLLGATIQMGLEHISSGAQVGRRDEPLGLGEGELAWVRMPEKLTGESAGLFLLG